MLKLWAVCMPPVRILIPLSLEIRRGKLYVLASAFKVKHAIDLQIDDD